MTWVDGKMTNGGCIVKGIVRMTWALAGGHRSHTKDPGATESLGRVTTPVSMLLLPLLGLFPTLIGDDIEFVSHL